MEPRRIATRQVRTCLGCGASVRLVELGTALIVFDPDQGDRPGGPHQCPVEVHQRFSRILNQAGREKR